MLSLQTKAQVEALREQLHTLAGQRDEAVMEVSSAREEAERSEAALSNLQTVLEQFQRGTCWCVCVCVCVCVCGGREGGRERERECVRER